MVGHDLYSDEGMALAEFRSKRLYASFPVPPLRHRVPSHKAAAPFGSRSHSLLGGPKKLGQEKGETLVMSYLFVKWNSFGRGLLVNGLAITPLRSDNSFRKCCLQSLELDF